MLLPEFGPKFSMAGSLEVLKLEVLRAGLWKTHNYLSLSMPLLQIAKL